MIASFEIEFRIRSVVEKLKV